jgi:hypothetical protein
VESSKNLNAIIEVTKATMKPWNFDLYQQAKKEFTINNRLILKRPQTIEKTIKKLKKIRIIYLSVNLILDGVALVPG